MVLEVLTAPDVEPVSLEEAKLHLKVEVDEDDDLVTGMIAAARQWAEGFLNRAIITQELRLSLPCFPGGADLERVTQQLGAGFPGGVIELPMPRLQSVDEVAYIDLDGAGQTLAEGAEGYQVDLRSVPGRLAPAYNRSWPSTRAGVFNAVSITYTAGYGDAADDVPQCVRRGILIVVGGLHENRQAWETGTIVTELKMGQLAAAEALLLPERIKRFL